MKVCVATAILGVFLWHSCRAHIGAPDDDSSLPRLDSMRLASIPSPKQKFIHLYFIDSENNNKTLITAKNDKTIGKRLKSLPVVYVTFNGHPTSDSLESLEYLQQKLFETGTPGILDVFLDWTTHKIPFVDGLTLADALGKMVSKILLGLDIPVENFHFIGHCIGADVATTTAKHLIRKRKTPVSRLTAFDPFINKETNMQNAYKYVNFVDTYHAGIYTPPYPPLGTVDFYPNAGAEQTGCSFKELLKAFHCSHKRSILLYAESIRVRVNALEVNFSVTDENLQVISSPRVATFGHNVDLTDKGTYYLPTNGESPYLINYF